VTVMTETGQPATERRGGEYPDWDEVRPGEEFPADPYDGDPGPEETNEYSWFAVVTHPGSGQPGAGHRLDAL